MKSQLVWIASLLLCTSLAFGSIDDGKALVDSGAACASLTNEQLESIGDYFMESIHPGKAHKYMDNMMGGDGSEYLNQMHINMAKRLYCNEAMYMGWGMMGADGKGTMYGAQMMQYNQGMMDWGFNTNSALLTVLLIGIVAIVYIKAYRMWKSSK